jgi:hypothetical protein
MRNEKDLYLVVALRAIAQPEGICCAWLLAIEFALVESATKLVLFTIGRTNLSPSHSSTGQLIVPKRRMRVQCDHFEYARLRL